MRPAARGRPAHRLRQHPGRLRHGLRLLRQRHRRRRPQPASRRDPRTAAARPQPAARRRAPDAHRRHGHGRAAGQPRQPARRPGRRHARPTGSASAPGTSHISTVGLPAKIRQLADLGKQYHLAVSLHAPNDELRNRIVPTNDKTGLAAILEAADYFYAQDRPAGDVRVRAAARPERPAASTRPSWPGCCAAGRRTST